MIIIIICLIISTFCYFSLPLDIGYKASLALAVFMMALELFVMFKRKEQYELLKNQYLRIFPILTYFCELTKLLTISLYDMRKI